MPRGLFQRALSKESQASEETGRQNTKDKLQKRDIDAYELSYAQLGHKNKMVLIGPYLSTF